MGAHTRGSRIARPCCDIVHACLENGYKRLSKRVSFRADATVVAFRRLNPAHHGRVPRGFSFAACESERSIQLSFR